MKTKTPIELNDAVIYQLAALLSGPMGLYPVLADLRVSLGLPPTKALSHNACAKLIRQRVYSHEGKEDAAIYTGN